MERPAGLARTTRRAFTWGAVSLAILLGVRAHSASDAEPIFGFAVASAEAQRRVEQRFLALPSADRARDYHRHLTDEPHLAGSERNR